MKAKTLSGLMSMEDSLARKQARDAISSLPEGHPILSEVEAMEDKKIGVEDLPSGHPLKVAIDEAQKRFEAEKEAQQAAPVRKARKIDLANQAKTTIAPEAIEKEERRSAAKALNGAIDRSLNSLDDVLAVARQSSALFSDEPFVRARLLRLERMSLAVRKGLIDSKISTVRFA